VLMDGERRWLCGFGDSELEREGVVRVNSDTVEYQYGC
jgi:hypothetical protein